MIIINQIILQHDLWMIERLILVKKGQYGTSFSNQPRTYYLNLPYVHSPVNDCAKIKFDYFSFVNAN